MSLAGRRVVLGVSGGIASYKACTIARLLTKAGAHVDVVLTSAGAEFVRPVTFEALTGRPVLSSLWDRGRALDHVRLADDPELIIVAPATANLIARCAQGFADDALCAILLARASAVLLAPAMNDKMYANEITQQNIAALKARGWETVGPEVGALAEGPSDLPGRMSEPEDIFAVAERKLLGGGALSGKRVLVSAGPTREGMDPVRVITNRSSGLMGIEVAREAYSRGADVTLVMGPTSLPPPYGVETIRIESTVDLAAAIADHVSHADVFVMAAAPADYKPVEVSADKLARSNGRLSVELEPTLDILESTAPQRKADCFCVGFALEAGDNIERAREKMRRKRLDLVVYNRVDIEGAGFEVATNRVTLMTKDGEQELPLMAKRAVAHKLFDVIEAGV